MNKKSSSLNTHPPSASDFSQPAIADLVRILQASDGMPVVPFVGAGLAVPYGLPGWSEFLLNHARQAKCLVAVRKLLGSKQCDRYEVAAEIIRVRKPHGLQAEIRNNLQRVLLTDELQKESAMRELTRFHNGAIITTNFDDVLEKVFTHHNCAFQQVHLGGLANIEDLPRFPRRRELLKLHGSTENPQTMVLTSAEYTEHYCDRAGILNVAKPLPAVLAHAAASTVLLFLGCSLESDRYLEVLAKHGRRGGVPHFAILSKPESEKNTLDRTDDLLGNYNIQPIWFERGEFAQIRLLLKHLWNPCYGEVLHKPIASFEVAINAPKPNSSLDLRPLFTSLLDANKQLSGTQLGKIPLGRLTLLNQGAGRIEIKAFPSFVDQGESSVSQLNLEPTDNQYFFTPQGPGGVKISFAPGKSQFRLIDTISNKQILARINDA